MTRAQIVFVVAAGMTVFSLVWALGSPPRRLADRVRPYANVARARLLRATDPVSPVSGVWSSSVWRQMIDPFVEGAKRAYWKVFGVRDEELLARRLRQSGLYAGLAPTERLDEFRTRSFLQSVAGAVGLGGFGWVTRGVTAMVTFAVIGFVLGGVMARGRVDGAVNDRRRVMQVELYTVNQILALRARAGGGVVDAIRHVVDRGHGSVVGELADALRLHRSGLPIAEALRSTADQSAEPEAARMYRALATAQERGVDLADALLALSRDLRVARRDEAVTTAAKRRIVAVVPLVMVLGPITIALMAAPLPSIVFGGFGQ